MKRILLLIVTVSLCAFANDLAAQTRQTTGRARAVGASKAKRVRPTTKAAALAKAAFVRSLPSGLTYVITQRTNGRQPRTGETVSVHYTGLLANGVKFDSSYDRGRPYSFPLGEGKVIKGWDEGIAKLHVGEQATLIIPPQLGYGPPGRGDKIPPNATLIFIVELVDIAETPGGN